ncbi:MULTISPECIES: dihydrolipoamide acetyltransferase family protein [Arthrobacter]|uniref:Dihydrolipoamide acetyltransferase component of pyruvate dehydrogenase complex n=1 Tax=Arthrobacter terricola TaxID=2547396 RepID=A0A4R5KHS8_9MICC|nr:MULTISPECIES: dihydrolipoamide acetyltransferase family protein [Arthrobacter]MBT8159253.1 2-oxo acid dehydrogenase subunit E2 [Arthrobacter sp. GN70]TDF94916.1 2-oxo acid dehydrogenase subunit E2 [Arthrobacter terricola]
MSADLQVFLLPDLGEGLTEAELVNWLVAVGDEIRVDQPIAEVETAKSMVEVPSPYAGIVAELHGEAGQTLDVGKPLISVARVGALVPAGSSSPEAELPADTQAAAAPAPAPSAASVEAEAYRTEEKAGSGNVLIGYGTSGSGEARRTRQRKVTASAVAVAATPDFADLSLARTRIPGKLSAVISPLVRKMARDHGVSLDTVAGSGESGLILRRDVEAAIAEPAAAPVPPRPEVASRTEDSTLDVRTGLAVASRTPVRGVRKAVAANMTRSRSEIPEATVWVDVDATALLDMRAELKKKDAQATPGLLAFIARFVTAGLKKFPELNTRFVTTEDAAGGESQEIVAFDGVNLGFAAQTDRGLVVPSVRNAHLMSARELDAEIRRLTAVARDGKATPTELASGTFTLNNYGVFGVDGSAAIINYPEVAMLGLGRIIDKPWVVDGQLAVRKVTELTLAFDHRVCDGETAAGFLRYVADAIENPGTALADL